MLDIKAETVAKRSFQDMSRHRIPKSLHSDQGTQFESAVFCELCRTTRIKKTSAYHSQDDGLVEDADRTIHDVLAAYVGDNHLERDCYLCRLSWLITRVSTPQLGTANTLRCSAVKSVFL